MTQQSELPAIVRRGELEEAFKGPRDGGTYPVAIYPLTERMWDRMEAVFTLPSVTPELVHELWSYQNTIRELHMPRTHMADDFEIEIVMHVVRAIADGRCSDPQACTAIIRNFDTGDFCSKN